MKAHDILIALIGADDPSLFAHAHEIRQRVFGNEVYIRAIVEFSNTCNKHCRYCGLRADNRTLRRYRMRAYHILETVAAAVDQRAGTVVLQSGDDPSYTAEYIGELVRQIKARHDVAVTPSLGDRGLDEYAYWRECGADRCLLKLETTDPARYKQLRQGEDFSARLHRVEELRRMGYEVGSGVIAGLPGTTPVDALRDILFLTDLGLDMIAVGPFVPNPDTPMAGNAPGSVDLSYRMTALLRILNPEANIPATSALDALRPGSRTLALTRGCNVLMPSMTPAPLRGDYAIYPGKNAGTDEDGPSLASARQAARDGGFISSSAKGFSPRGAMSDKAPRGVRLVIALTGRRNAGKSSLLNALTGQETAIVSDTPGTTTDPVAKHYELLPLGPVTFYDTAGLDDTGDLGGLRMKATRKVLYRSDVAVVVVGEEGVTAHERAILDMVKGLSIPCIVAFNKTDLRTPASEELALCQSLGAPCLTVCARTGAGADELKRAIIDAAPLEFRQERLLVGDLISEGDWVVCVVPIDLAAPKGRLILPQVQVLREILDCDAVAVTVKEREIEAVLAGMGCKPALVVTDSQVVMSVAGDVPDDIPLTTFSTLFARYKGDLPSLVRGADAIDSLEDGDTVLIGEACSHHDVADDIGRVKIPRWMTQYTGRDLRFEVYAGHDFPDDLERYRLVVHCGACMLGRTEMLRRINECARRGLPVTNYGVAISKVQGVLDRIIAPFPELRAAPLVR